MDKKTIQARIAKLEKQVKRTEAKGNYDSAHHIMLARYKQMLKAPKPVESVISRNAAKTGDTEDPKHGISNRS